ncbi:MAG: Mini-ribonuclease 3 [Firmicutes bacterium]|nr:Mini-ribonuclease 3 [Bacillota bacterium]
MRVLSPDDFSPAAWAYIGDAYYELAMRVLTLSEGPKHMSAVHQATAHFVRASFQARAAHAISELLTEKEKDILRRGRNVRSGHVPKSASVTEYRHSTGIESLIGYLYLAKDEERALEIICAIRQLKEGDTCV